MYIRDIWEIDYNLKLFWFRSTQAWVIRKQFEKNIDYIDTTRYGWVSRDIANHVNFAWVWVTSRLTHVNVRERDYQNTPSCISVYFYLTKYTLDCHESRDSDVSVGNIEFAWRECAWTWDNVTHVPISWYNIKNVFF